jgi:hypothetical protein
VDNRPVDFLIVMHGNIPKSYRLLELLRHRFGNDSDVGQRIESLSHRIRRLHIQVSNEVCAKVHAQLHGSTQIEGDDILEIRTPA